MELEDSIAMLQHPLSPRRLLSMQIDCLSLSLPLSQVSQAHKIGKSSQIVPHAQFMQGKHMISLRVDSCGFGDPWVCTLPVQERETIDGYGF